MGLTESKPTSNGQNNRNYSQPKFTKEQVLNHVDKVFKITSTNKQDTDSEFSQTLNWLTETFQEGGDLDSIVQTIKNKQFNLSDVENRNINYEQLNKFLMQLGGGNGEETEPETDETEITETLRYSNNSSSLMSASFSDKSRASIRHKLAGGCACAEGSNNLNASSDVFSVTSMNTINNMRGGNVLSATSFSESARPMQSNINSINSLTSEMSRNGIIQGNEFNINAFSETSNNLFSQINQDGGAKKKAKQSKKSRKQKRQESRKDGKDSEDMDLDLDTEEDELVDLDDDEEDEKDSSDELENLEDESDETDTMKMVRSESEKRDRRRNERRRLSRVMTDEKDSSDSSVSSEETSEESLSTTGSSDSSESSESPRKMARMKKSSKKVAKKSSKKGKASKKMIAESSISEFNAIPFYSSDNSTDFYRSFESRNRFD